jgi:hypothetical protein
MRLGRLAILTLISTALLGGQFATAALASSLAKLRQDGTRAQTTGSRPVIAAPDLLAPDDESPHEQAPAPQLPADPASVHGEEIQSKDFATDFLFAQADRADVRGAFVEMHSHSELVRTSELTLYGLHRLQI